MNKIGFVLFFLVLLVFATLCWWQLQRYQTAVTLKQEHLAQSNSFLVRGSFDLAPLPATYWLLDNISQQHQPGYYVLRLFLMPEQGYKLVVTDWLASSGDRALDAQRFKVPKFPINQLEVEIWDTSYLQPDPYPWQYFGQDDHQTRSAIIQTIDIDRIKQDMGIQDLGIGSDLELVTQIKAGQPVVTVAEAWLVPERHLGYAMTWGLLGVCWCIIWLVNALRSRRTSVNVKQ